QLLPEHDDLAVQALEVANDDRGPRVRGNAVEDALLLRERHGRCGEQEAEGQCGAQDCSGTRHQLSPNWKLPTKSRPIPFALNGVKTPTCGPTPYRRPYSYTTSSGRVSTSYLRRESGGGAPVAAPACWMINSAIAKSASVIASPAARSMTLGSIVE